MSEIADLETDDFLNSIETEEFIGVGYFGQAPDDWEPVLRPRVEPERYELKPGEFHSLNGRVYKTILSQQGRIYCKELVGERWIYAPGVSTKIHINSRITLEKAKEYGRQTGNCLICGRELTNPNSIANGIGPICAGRL